MNVSDESKIKIKIEITHVFVLGFSFDGEHARDGALCFCIS